MLASPRLVQRGRLLPVLGVLAVVCLVAFVRYRAQSQWAGKLTGTRPHPPPLHDIAHKHTQGQGPTLGQVCPDVAHLHDGDGNGSGAVSDLNLDLSPVYRYSRRCVQPIFRHKTQSFRLKRPEGPAVRRPPTRMGGRLVPARADMVVVNHTAIGTACDRPLPPCEPLVLDVPYPYPQPSASNNYSHLLFGVASSPARMMKALDGFAHWLGGTGAQLVAIVQDEDDAALDWLGEEEEEDVLNGGNGARRGKTAAHLADLAALETAYRARGIDLKAMPPQHKLARTVVQNHFAILMTLLKEAKEQRPQTTWFSIVDDDTFFPSLYQLDETLKKYDHTRPAWLGALSEDADALKLWGRMAYGGAGVFVSVPLAETVTPYIGECLRQGRNAALALQAEGVSRPAADRTTTGDSLLRDCITRHAHETSLTLVPGLNQHDLYGDISGFYEAGLSPLSVHHWRSWYKVPLPAMAAVTRLCGDCFLGRWVWPAHGGGQEETLFANGFSVTQYRTGIHPDFRRMEETWSHAGDEFAAALGPLRPALNETDKKSFRLRGVVTDKEDGIFRQVYVYKGAFGTDEPDEVFELVWE